MMRKSIIIGNIVRCLYIVTQKWLQELGKVRYEICYANWGKNQEKKGRGATHKKKKNRKTHTKEQEIQEMSINDILEKVQERSKQEFEVPPETGNSIVTPLREPAYL